METVGIWTITVGGVLIFCFAIIGIVAACTDPIGQGACLELCQGVPEEVNRLSCICQDGEIKKRWVPSTK